MAGGELAVTILWHLHQPDYVDSRAGRARLPWVRLHALFSYFDTLRVLREVTDARAVLNLSPVLLRQLEAGPAVEDEFLTLARKPPAELSAAERALLLQRFFAFHHGRRFVDLPRLGELWQKRQRLGGRIGADDAGAFDDQELLDLQVGFQLAWSGRTLREHELVTALFRKGLGFTAQEKNDLLDLQDEFLQGVLPAYREAARSAAVEISCTPLAHPILPLLCDTESAREAVPDLSLPAVRIERPGDAWYHVRTALDETERILGVRPSGMWPAEGSVSEEAVRVFATEGVSWLGSDEEVLAASLAPDESTAAGFCQAFRWGGEWAPALFFRDRDLSDRIGFVYANWSPRKAAADLVQRLQQLAADLPAGPHLLPLILDGENPWEYYADGGIPFLRELYQGVAAAEGLRWSTFADFLAESGGEARPLDRLVAGSWIRRDFTTWIGHPEKNAAWERLAAVRQWLEERLAAAGAVRTLTLAGSGREVPAPDPDLVGPGCAGSVASAWQAMAAAQGSDWFWWYGDDHVTDFATEFDS